MRLQKLFHSIFLWVLSTFVCSKHNHLLLVPVFLFCSIWHASYKPVVKKSAHIQGTISFQTLNYQVKNKVRFILLSGFYYKKIFKASKSAVYNWEWFQIKSGLYLHAYGNSPDTTFHSNNSICEALLENSN